MAVVFIVLTGCETKDVTHGALRIQSPSWLIRPGAPAKHLNRQLAELLPASPQASDKEIFADYQEDGTAQWAANWTQRLDFSGIAWDSPRAGTLIHPQYVVFASHFPRRVGDELVFHDRAGKPVKRRIAAKKILFRVRSPDLSVARLDRPVPDTVAHYPLLPMEHQYRFVLVGAPLLVTDKERQVHLFHINRVLTRDRFEIIGARPAMGNELGAAWQKRLEKGDSGHPAFIYLDGRLVLVSTLKGGGWASQGPFLGGRRLQTALVGAMEELDSVKKRAQAGEN